MNADLLATILIALSIRSSLTEPPKEVLIALKQKFTSSINIRWTEEAHNYHSSSYFIDKIRKYVQDDENTWEADFMPGHRKTSATFDLKGHWLTAKQEIKLEEIGVDEARSATDKE